ncbi:ribonuclease H-like domain-containing protein [Tanacetum coccineum]
MVTRNQDGTRKTTQRLNLHVSHISHIPKSPSLALSDPHWRDAMYDEYNDLIKNGTWVLVSRDLMWQYLRCLVVYYGINLCNGFLSQYKARLVANGSSQQLGINCDETFSPLDVKNAFLNGDLSETVYMHQPLEDYFSLHKEFDRQICALNYFLGISVTRDSTGMFLSQKKYAMELLKRAHMLNCNPTRTPVDTESKLGPEGTPISDPTLYRSLAGGLQYLTFTRPDLSYAVQ